MKPLLEIDGLTKSYGPNKVLDQVSLQMGDGEFFFLLGPSGCGKTTLLRIIGGLIEADSGTISLNGESLNDIPAYRRDINTVFQNYALFPHLSVFENVAFGLRMKKKPSGMIREKVIKALGLVELDGFEDRMPGKLSGGQQQRVALARALVNEPSVLLLDEPLGALDVKLRRQMQLELKHLQRNLGTTFICVTHDQEEAMTMADRIAVMREGIVEQTGTPEEIYNHPRTRFVANFMGESNFFTGCDIRAEGGTISIHLDDGSTVLAPADGSRSADGLLPGVRPEKIDITGNRPGDASVNAVQGTVEEIVFVGTMLYYMVRIANGLLFRVISQTISSRQRVAEGDRVYLAWPVEDTFVVEG
ncbi:MAG: ABC transporter ATP-binding protein [Balneolaceae bacterium]|nr:MAG: ABC transporter ATP-binding protein [Balneolaceae bacterium]